MRTVSKSSLIATLCVSFLDTFGMYVVLPIFSPLILKVQGSILHEAISIEGRMFFLSILIASFPLAQLFGAPLFGTIGDVMGRKKALLLSLVGEAIGYAGSAVALGLESYTFLLASRFFTGFFAGNLAIVWAIIADHTNEKIGRYRIYGIQTALLGLGLVLAVTVGGILSSRGLAAGLDPRLPFWITCGLALVNLVVISACYQEATGYTQDEQKFRPFRTAQLKLIATAFFLFALGYLPTLQFLSAYMIEQFEASHLVISLTFLAVGLTWFLASGLFHRVFIRLYAHHTLTVKVTRWMCFFLLITCLVPTYPLFLICFLLYTFAASLVWTGTTTTLSFESPPDRQGRILGFSQSLLTSAALAGPLIIGLVGGAHIKSGYYFSLSILILASFIFYYYTQKNISSYKKN